MKKNYIIYKMGVRGFVVSLLFFLLLIFAAELNIIENRIVINVVAFSLMGLMLISAVLVFVSGYADQRVNFEERLYKAVDKRKKETHKKKVKVLKPKSAYDLILIDYKNDEIRRNIKKSFNYLYSIKSDFLVKDKKVIIEFKNGTVSINLHINKNYCSYFVLFSKRTMEKIEKVYELTRDFKLSVDYIFGYINGENEVYLPFVLDEPSKTYMAITDFVKEKIEQCDEVFELLRN
ncbi:hypothetical protein RJI07_07870 [Mycoplasmatota bacterium WC30]